MFAPTTRILIVDDMLTMRKIVKKTLVDMGFKNVSDASDGIQAWNMIRAETGAIDLVICDWNMPKCSGIELLRKVRGMKETEKMAFILLTAESETKQVAEAVQAGVTDYIIKPFTPDVMRTKLEAAYRKISKAAA